MRKIVLSGFALILALGAAHSAAFGQKETDKGVQIEKDLELVRRDLRSEKKKIIAASLPLTETEAVAFWPVYDQYAGQMTKHYDEFYAIIKEYAVHRKR